jgi:hypothetical protein
MSHSLGYAGRARGIQDSSELMGIQGRPSDRFNIVFRELVDEDNLLGLQPIRKRLPGRKDDVDLGILEVDFDSCRRIVRRDRAKEVAARQHTENADDAFHGGVKYQADTFRGGGGPHGPPDDGRRLAYQALQLQIGE